MTAELNELCGYIIAPFRQSHRTDWLSHRRRRRRDRGHVPKFGKKLCNYHVKFVHYSGKYHEKFGNFVINFSYIIVGQKYPVPKVDWAATPVDCRVCWCWRFASDKLVTRLPANKERHDTLPHTCTSLVQSCSLPSSAECRQNRVCSGALELLGHFS